MREKEACDNQGPLYGNQQRLGGLFFLFYYLC